MNHRRRVRAWVLALCVLATGGGVRGGDAPHWLTDWEQGRKVARQTGKPLFVVFRCEH